MMKKHLSAVLACACAMLTSTAFATTTDFHRTILGNWYQGGTLSGNFLYEFHYNTAPEHVGNVFDPNNEAGHVQAYAPFSGFAYEFYANLILFDNGSVVQQQFQMPIYKFVVVNDVQTSPGQPHDALVIETHSALGDIQMTFSTLDSSTLSDTSLNAILIQDTFHDIIAANNGRVNPNAGDTTSQWRFTAGNATFVSGPIPDIPTPGTLPLVALSLGACAWFVRKPCAKGPALPAF